MVRDGAWLVVGGVESKNAWVVVASNNKNATTWQDRTVSSLLVVIMMMLVDLTVVLKNAVVNKKYCRVGKKRRGRRSPTHSQ